MLFWPAIFVSSLLQEPTVMGALLLTGLHEGRSIWIILLLWTIATVLSTVLGFYFGLWLRRRFPRAKAVLWAERVAPKIQHRLGNSGTIWLLLLLGFFSFPWLNGFIAPWLDIELVSAAVWITIGDFVWYFIEWLAILGLAAAVPNFEITLAIVIGLGLLGTFLWRFVRNKTGLMR